MKNGKRIINAVTTVLVVIVVLLAVLTVGVRLFGINPYAVISGSMEPEYPVGALIYVKPIAADKLEVGDVITFMVNEEMTATHRIVDIIQDEENPSVLRFQTKGDANDSPDANLVHCNNVIGKPIFKIPFLGYISDFVRKPPGLYFAIGIIVLLILLEFLPDLIFPKEETDLEEKNSDEE